LKRCEKCGFEVKIRDATFCPACGGRLIHFIPSLSEDKRILLFFASLALSVAVTLVGLTEKIPPSEALSVRDQYRGMDEFLWIGGLQYIFGNNVMICLLTFIPLLGPLNGLYALYRTGWIIAALSASSGRSPLEVYAILWTRYSHTWLEYCAVSLALSESIILSYYLLRYRWRGFRMEAKNVPLYLTYCVIALFFAAIAEIAAM